MTGAINNLRTEDSNVILGGATTVSMDASTDALCDLGRPTKRYKDSYVAGVAESNIVKTTVLQTDSIAPPSDNLVVDGGIYSGIRPVCTGGYAQIAEVTVTNTIVETTMINATGALGTLTLPANIMRVGSTSVLRCSGLIDTGNTNEVITFRLFSGATQILKIVQTGLNMDAASAFSIELISTVKTVGVTGSITTTGTFTAGNTSLQAVLRVRTQTTVIDTTVANTLNITAEWGAAKITNVITTQIVNAYNVYQPPA